MFYTLAGLGTYLAPSRPLARVCAHSHRQRTRHPLGRIRHTPAQPARPPVRVQIHPWVTHYTAIRTRTSTTRVGHSITVWLVRRLSTVTTYLSPPLSPLRCYFLTPHVISTWTLVAHSPANTTPHARWGGRPAKRRPALSPHRGTTSARALERPTAHARRRTWVIRALCNTPCSQRTNNGGVMVAAGWVDDTLTGERKRHVRGHLLHLLLALDLLVERIDNVDEKVKMAR